MRCAATLAALTASVLLSRVESQATAYGNPDGDWSPADSSDGLPDGSDTASTALPDSESAPPSAQPTCPFGHDQTTTVFVTVVPSNPASSPVSVSGDASSDMPDKSKLSTTFWKATRPSTTVDLTSIEASLSESPVKPFTTITIDIWGTPTGTAGGWSGEQTGSPADASNEAPGNGGGNTSNLGDATQPGSDGRHGPTSAGGASSLPPSYTDTSGSDSDSGSDAGGSESSLPKTVTSTLYHNTGGSNGGMTDSHPNHSDELTVSTSAAFTPGLPWSTVVTDTDVHWLPGASGPTPVTIFSSHTIVMGGPTLGVSDDAGAPITPASGGPMSPVTCITIIGADGKPTVIDTPSGASFSMPFPTSLAGAGAGAGGPSLPSSVYGPYPASVSAGQPATTSCVVFTVVGDDGLPTVTEATLTIPVTQSGSGDGGSPFTPAGSPYSPITPAPVPFPDSNGEATATTSFTMVGADGFPTVVETTYVVNNAGNDGMTSGAAVTAAPGQPSDVAGGPNGNAVTTCLSYTVVGDDGLPTIIESTVVLPSPTSGPYGMSSADAASAISANNGPGFPSGGIMTSTCYTYYGADGKPTTVDTTWMMPAPMTTPGAFPTPNPFTDSMPPSLPGMTPAGAGMGTEGITTCTSYTYLGADGLPTVTESTYVIAAPGPSITDGAGLPFPSPAGSPGAITGLPGYPTGPFGDSDGSGVTTCLSYTYTGADGQPTVVETTLVVPTPFGNGGIPFPTALPATPALPTPNMPSADDGVTACLSYTVFGPDGSPTVIETSIVIEASSALAATATTHSSFFGGMSPPSWPSMTVPDFSSGPSMFPQPYSGGGQNADDGIVTYTTVTFLGPNGIPTPVIESATISHLGSGDQTGRFTAASQVGGAWPTPQAGLPAYGTLSAAASPVLQPPSFQTLSPVVTAMSAVDGMTASPLITDTQTSTFTVIVGPDGAGLPAETDLPPSYGDSQDGGLPFPGSDGSPAGDVQSEITLWPANAGSGETSAVYGTPGAGIGGDLTTTLESSTWVNVIPEVTTTYTFGFPLTTLAVVPVAKPVSPFKRHLRRQDGSAAWGNLTTPVVPPFGENTALGASLSSALGMLTPTPTPTPTPGSAMCSYGGKIGNVTIDFDDQKTGPLFNPSDDFWFSEGFVVAPPSINAAQAYVASSGGQLVEFVPPALTGSMLQGSGDTAEIGVGPNAANPCFRFNFYGASLGCAAEGSEQWCEFEVAAYTASGTSGTEQSVAWVETKRVPACPTFPSSACSLTPVEFDGYTDLTSILITLRVGLDLRVWWGDDFRMGWTDNSCTAAACRASPTERGVKRDEVASVVRRGVWQWTPQGLDRVDDETIWEAAE